MYKVERLKSIFIELKSRENFEIIFSKLFFVLEKIVSLHTQNKKLTATDTVGSKIAI